MSIHKPAWFSDDNVMVSTAPTCGLGKGGRLLALIDPKTGDRVQEIDPETGGQVDAINDQLLRDMEALKVGEATETLRFAPKHSVSLRAAVPTYYDRRYDDALSAALESELAGFEACTVSELVESGVISLGRGHGSPSADQRVGRVPYIKVSDLRAGLVNINPTNRVPRKVAVRHWGAEQSGLQAFDLLSPERTSKNIGDFCILMPGQEQVLLTKEIIVLRPGKASSVDSFYLLWALSLKVVRDQWRRVVFMQTNREDVGDRFLEIKIPYSSDKEQCETVSQPFREYFTHVADARETFGEYLRSSGAHHFFLNGSSGDEGEGDDALAEEGDSVD